MGLRDIDLKEEYRSDRDDIIGEFIFPCLRNCTEYDRCVDFLSVDSLVTLAEDFDSFAPGKARLRMITGHKFKTRDLATLTRLFAERQGKIFDGAKKDLRLQKLQAFEKGQIRIKIALPNSEQVTGTFSERIGIFRDGDGQAVAFTGIAKESFPTREMDFESVDVFTSWNDGSRVEAKQRGFENLWANRTEYVEVCDFTVAEGNNLLKFSTDWVFKI